jgi:hypothetical protein
MVRWLLSYFRTCPDLASRQLTLCFFSLQGFRYNNSRATNPDFNAGITWFVVTAAARSFINQAFCNASTAGTSVYKTVAPFFLNETFPPNWFRRYPTWGFAEAMADVAVLHSQIPYAVPGANEGSVSNFVPLSPDLRTFSPAQLGCFFLQTILDDADGQAAQDFAVYAGFLQGVLAPFFFGDGLFDCSFQSFTQPGQDAGVTPNGVSSSGSPVNGAYPGIGVIAPGSQPS